MTDYQYEKILNNGSWSLVSISPNQIQKSEENSSNITYVTDISNVPISKPIITKMVSKSRKRTMKGFQHVQVR